METTLLHLSQILIDKGYPDLFDFDVERDILDIENMVGSVAGGEGDDVFEFKILKIGKDAESGFLTHLDTIVKYDGRGPRKTKDTLIVKD